MGNLRTYLKQRCVDFEVKIASRAIEMKSENIRDLSNQLPDEEARASLDEEVGKMNLNFYLNAALAESFSNAPLTSFFRCGGYYLLNKFV
jgi:hypothetical protein